MQAILLVLLFALPISFSLPCVQRSYGGVVKGFVCVCNATYCDDIEQIGEIPQGQYVLYRSDIDGTFMQRSLLSFTDTPGDHTAILDADTIFQEIIGFGGSFTDSAGINIVSLPEAAQELLIKQYFGPTGTEYTIGRVPMASTDFSTHEYSYADTPDDYDLATFALQDEDRLYKIPFMKRAAELQEGYGGLKIFASPWSAPAWMKSNGAMKGGGQLRGFPGGPYYITWANYFVRFLEEYRSAGIPIWAVTVQNEPTTGLNKNYKWQTMYFSASGERDFVRDQLGPTIRNSSVGKDVLIMGLDDNRYLLPEWANTLYEDDVALGYLAGIGVHWYEDDIFPVEVLDMVHEKHPDKFMLATEACNGWLRIGKGVNLGDFARAEAYAHSIIEDLNHYVAGWTDWNLALDPTGGPTFVSNNVDAPIIVDAKKGEFLKQPMYYAMAHFSKFLKPGSHRVELYAPEGLPDQIHLLGAVAEDGKRVVVVLNRNSNQATTISVAEKSDPSKLITIDLPAHSLVTVVWNQQ